MNKKPIPASQYYACPSESEGIPGKGKINKAFTLVELIVVITILAILGTIAFISLQGYSRDARDSTRTADLGNMKTSLELFSLKTGNYPKPDNFSTITYSGGTENVWYQGIVGDQVTTNLKSLNEKPLDPLLNTPYTYSVTQSFGEYEILALYEGSVAYQVPFPERGGLGRGLFPQANAATTTLTPKVVGNYNGVYVTTTNYIIPIPSIITAEPGNIILDGTNIRSQVITNGINIPKNNLSSAQTGALIGFNLAVFTGSITKNSPKAKKVEAITQIQQAYTGATSLNTKQNIAYILNQTSTGQIVALTDITLLKGQSSLTSNTSINNISILPVVNPYINCTGVNTPIIGDINIIATTTYDSCNIKDIIVCAGVGSGYTIAACNVGTNTGGITSISYGSYFQFGKNTLYPIWSNGNSGWNNDWKSPGLIDGGSANNWGVLEANKSTATYNSVSTTNKVKMQGPCFTGYHVPTMKEWGDVYIIGGWLNNRVKLINDLQLPLNGNRNMFGVLATWNQGTYSEYWTSSPSNDTSFTFYVDNFNNTSGIHATLYTSRSYGFGVRCFKN